MGDSPYSLVSTAGEETTNYSKVFKSEEPQYTEVILANEFNTLLKETSVSGYIGLIDLTKAGDIIRSRTFAAFFPLLAVALIYLIMVVVLSAGVTRLERRLRNGAR